MADPHQLLSPLVEPSLPPVPVLASVSAWSAAPVMGTVLLLAALAMVSWLLWRRNAIRRTLRRIARTDNPAQAAHALAALMRQRGLTPPLAWRDALDRIRFGPPAAEHAQTMAHLCGEARVLLKA